MPHYFFLLGKYCLVKGQDGLFMLLGFRGLLIFYINRKNLSFEYNAAFISFVVAMLNTRVNR